MPSQKKHKKPKVERVDATSFAAQYAISVGSYDGAIINASNMEKISRDKSTKTDIPLEDTKEAKRTADFWANVAGVLKKQQLKMTGGTKARA
jgi:hypothetical protein